MPELTQSRLKEVMHYDPESGIFTWKEALSRRVHAGDQVGSLDKASLYIRVWVDNKRFRAHRLAWLYVYGYFPTVHIDHINHNRSDNRICNLRDASMKENQQNAKLRVDNTSGFTGVFWNKNMGKWGASIMANGKHENLGFFMDKESAIKARKRANDKYGFHKNHGLPLGS